MALILLEGLDRTGKSSVAEYYATKGYELIHQSAPPKGMTADLFLEEMVQLVSSASNKDVILDRSYWGETIWPVIYNRESLLQDESLEILKELEDSVGTTKILMHDPNVEAHWKRCVDNKEPLTKVQFIKARSLYNTMADKYGFVKKTLKDFPELAPSLVIEAKVTSTDSTETIVPQLKLTKEQLKLETANAINEVLSKRIIKSKGPIFDQLENNIRVYLNTELGKIFGTKTEIDKFSDKEVELLKFFCKQLEQKVSK